MRFKVVRICNSEANTCIPLDAVNFDLDLTKKNLEQLGYSAERKDLMITAKKDGVEFTLYRTGKLLIHPMAKEKAKEAAEIFYAHCISSEPEDRSL
jgi:ribonuclease HIII